MMVTSVSRNATYVFINCSRTGQITSNNSVVALTEKNEDRNSETFIAKITACSQDICNKQQDTVGNGKLRLLVPSPGELNASSLIRPISSIM